MCPMSQTGCTTVHASIALYPLSMIQYNHRTEKPPMNGEYNEKSNNLRHI